MNNEFLNSVQQLISEVDEILQEAVKNIAERKLTKAEYSKKKEIAKALEKDDPNMPDDKKYAIATATAKKVAEQEELDLSLDQELEGYFTKQKSSIHKPTLEYLNEFCYWSKTNDKYWSLCDAAIYFNLFPYKTLPPLIYPD